MDTKKLKHFLALVDAQNFSAAADAVHLTQPAFSRSIQSLEDELGVELFDRSQRTIRLSSAGALLLQRARQILLDVENLNREAMRITELMSGTLDVGVGPFPARNLGAGACAEFISRYPNIQLTLTVDEPKKLAEKLVTGALDLAIVDHRAIPDMTNILFQPLPQSPSITVTRPQHPLVGRKGLQAEDIRRYPLATVSQLAKIAVAQALGLDQPMNDTLFAYECNSVDLLALTLKKCDAIGFVVSGSIESELERSDLVVIDFPALNYQFHSQFGIATYQPRLNSLATDVYIDIVNKLAGVTAAE